MWLAAAQGVICYGPDRDGAQCFVLVKDWLGETKAMEREKALAELAVRYLKAHAPARPCRPGVLVRDPHWRRDASVEVDRGPPHRGRDCARQAVVAARPVEPAPGGIVRLLPAFDEYLLGWRDREVALAPEHRAKVNRGGGWLHPVVLVDGHVVATWSATRTPKKLNLAIAPFSRLTPAVRRAAATEAEEVAAFLGFR